MRASSFPRFVARSSRDRIAMPREQWNDRYDASDFRDSYTTLMVPAASAGSWSRSRTASAKGPSRWLMLFA